MSKNRHTDEVYCGPEEPTAIRTSTGVSGSTPQRIAYIQLARLKEASENGDIHANAAYVAALSAYESTYGVNPFK